MSDFVACGEGWYVEVTAKGDAVREGLEYELGGFLTFHAAAPPGSRRLATIEVNADPDSIERWARRTVGQRYHDLVMNFPNRQAGRCFGRHATIDGVEVVFGTTSGAIFLINSSIRHVEVLQSTPTLAEREVRRLIRDQLYTHWMQQNKSIVVHSSAFVDSFGRGILVVAPSGGGKTSFFLSALASGRYQMFSGDRTLVTRRDDKLYLTAPPMMLNMFPGSLASYPTTAHLVEHDDPSQHWEGHAKFHVRWRELFRYFGGRLATNPAPLNWIIAPRFGATWALESMSIDDLGRTLIDEIHSDGGPLTLPNWLAFYRHDGCDEKLRELITSTPAVAVDWSDVREIDQFLANDLAAVFPDHLQGRCER
jgi:hypothetical protein